jgi:hypothetical protein
MKIAFPLEFLQHAFSISREEREWEKKNGKQPEEEGNLADRENS